MTESATTPMPTYRANDLIDFAKALFFGVGLSEDRAEVIGRLLVEGDLLGHTTHGLHLGAPLSRSRHVEGSMRARKAIPRLSPIGAPSLPGMAEDCRGSG